MKFRPTNTFATMAFTRTPETIALNAKLEIRALKGLYFNTHKGMCRFSRGYAFFIPGKGFVKFKHEKTAVPYSPCGGKSALESIIRDGGFVDYDSLEFVNALNEPVA